MATSDAMLNHFMKNGLVKERAPTDISAFMRLSGGRARSKLRSRSKSKAKKPSKLALKHKRMFDRIIKRSRSKSKCMTDVRDKALHLFYKERSLLSHGRRVKSPKQAIAIALNKARRECRSKRGKAAF
jgi:hypothetical protein